MKLKKEEFKQLFLIIFAVVLILIGYCNFGIENIETDDTIKEFASRNNDINIGDVELVNADDIKNDIVPNEEQEETINKNDYFEDTRLERNKMYSEMIENYTKLIENEKTPEEQKAIASEEISNITKQKNSIMIAENLIMNKGFENVIILINKESISVIVKSAALNQTQISQIQNIVEREICTQNEKINITSRIY